MAGYIIVLLFGILVGAVLNIALKIVLWHLAIAVLILIIFAMCYSVIVSGGQADERADNIFNILRKRKTG